MSIQDAVSVASPPVRQTVHVSVGVHFQNGATTVCNGTTPFIIVLTDLSSRNV